jgi:hypothetical protein
MPDRIKIEGDAIEPAQSVMRSASSMFPSVGHASHAAVVQHEPIDHAVRVNG